MQASQPFNPALRDRFNEFCNSKNFSLRDLTTCMGGSAAAFSKYRNGKPEGDVAALEVKIEDFLKAQEAREVAPPSEQELFETVVVKQVHNVCDLAKRHSMIGMVVGEPGLGKSCAIDLYKKGDSLCIPIELNTVLGGGTPSALVRAFFRQVQTSSYSRVASTKGEWLVERFSNSGRLIIIDNAHLLSQNGLEWLLGFHDATGCPVVLVGNSELKITMRKVQRGPSRVGVAHECTLKKTLATVAEAYLSRAWPDAGEEVLALATGVLERPGRLRTLRHITRVARGWMGMKNMGSAADAFRAAMNRQIEDYKLAA